jgi:hypothetical protein
MVAVANLSRVSGGEPEALALLRGGDTSVDSIVGSSRSRGVGVLAALAVEAVA